jgi:hypothetical protein
MLIREYSEFEEDTYPHKFNLKREHDLKQMITAFQKSSHGEILIFSEEVLIF